jgi:hypothetical protein
MKHYIITTELNRLSCLGEELLFIVRTIWNTQIHCVGRMQSLVMLKRVVHIIFNGL